MNINSVTSEYNKFGVKEVLYHTFYRISRGKNAMIRMYQERDKKYHVMSPSEIKSEIEDQYRKRMREDFDIDHPKNFNQKIQWIKFYDVTTLKTKLADKYLVREWVKNQIGSTYLIPLLGVWNSFEEIDLRSLPESFVLKANHGSGMNYIVKEKSKLNYWGWKKIKKKTNQWMNFPFHAVFLEFHYKDIPRKIIAEKYIEEMNGNLLDYKIHCFHGEPKIIQIIGDRDLFTHKAKEASYDTSWIRNDLMYQTYEQYDYHLNKPGNLDEMLNIARKLSKDFIYVRVDLYDVDGKIYFGEMTFTPASGYGEWGGKNSNHQKVGNMIHLEEI